MTALGEFREDNYFAAVWWKGDSTVPESVVNMDEEFGRVLERCVEVGWSRIPESLKL